MAPDAPLRLRAEDADDLAVISAVVQDALREPVKRPPRQQDGDLGAVLHDGVEGQLADPVLEATVGACSEALVAAGLGGIVVLSLTAT